MLPEVPVDGTSRGEETLCAGRGLRRLIAGTALGAGLWLIQPTGAVEWTDLPARGIADAASRPVTEPAEPRRTLAELAETALARMSPEARALYEEIAAFAAGFGEPVDVIAILREVREDA
jgi:hypothetical protein